MPGLWARRPVWGARGNHSLMFLSLSFSLPFPFSKSKIFLKKLQSHLWKQGICEEEQVRRNLGNIVNKKSSILINIMVLNDLNIA